MSKLQFQGEPKKWIKYRRKVVLELTQEQMSNLSDISIDTIRSIEAGRRRITEMMALALVNALQIPQDQVKEFVEFTQGLNVFLVEKKAGTENQNEERIVTNHPCPQIPVVSKYNFQSNPDVWNKMSDSDKFGTVKRDLTDGIYSLFIEPSTSDGFGVSGGNIIRVSKNFFCAVDTSILEGSSDYSSGIAFSALNDSNYYFFGVRQMEQKWLLVSVEDDNNWKRIIPPHYERSILIDKPNRVAIWGTEQLFRFYVNNYLVAEHTIEKPFGNKVDVLGVARTKPRLITAFYKFELRMIN